MIRLQFGLLLFFFLLISCSREGVYEEKIGLPEEVQSAFRSVYPDIQADWNREGRHYKVEFEENGVQKEWTYSSDGTITASEEEILIGSLFPSVLNYVHSNYGEYAVQAAFIGESRMGRYYELELKGDQRQSLELVFDADGNFLRERFTGANKDENE